MRSAARACLLALLLALPSCAARSGPPPIRKGQPCAACGMAIQDLRFACERLDGRAWRAFDAIECLARDAGGAGDTTLWLADYDRMSLHRGDSVWVVQGEFPSPMGGGLAAFLSRPAADAIAAETRGRVMRVAALLAPGGMR